MSNETYRAGTARVMTWDWKERIDTDELAAIIFDLSEGKLHVSSPDTDCDEYALVVSTVKLGPFASRDAFRRWWVSEDEDGDRLDEIPVVESP